MDHVMVGSMRMTYKIHGIQAVISSDYNQSKATESRSFVLLAVF